MKKLENYLFSLFRKYNVWTLVMFSMLLVLVFHINDVKLTIKDLSLSLNTYEYLLLFAPILVFLLGMGNFKNKVNIVDLLIYPMIFGYVYLAICLNSIYYYIISGLLFTIYIIRGFTYKYSANDIEPNIKNFMAKLNYHFPIVVIFILAFILPFVIYYLNQYFECYNIVDSVIYIICNVLVYIYLIFSLIMGRKKIIFVDYLYFLLIPYLISSIMFNGFIESFESLIIPLVCFMIRADMYSETNYFKKKKYFSELLARHSIVLPMIAGSVVSYVLYYTSDNNLFGLSQNLYVFLFAFVFILLLGVIIIFGNFKNKKIGMSDYWLNIEFNLTYYAVIYFVMGLLKINFDDFLSKFKDDLFISVGAIVIGLCFIINLCLYVIRYKSYDKLKNYKESSDLNDLGDILFEDIILLENNEETEEIVKNCEISSEESTVALLDKMETVEK